MAEEVQSGGEAQSFKKAWGVTTGSISAQFQSVVAQIISDSRLPCSNVAGLLNVPACWLRCPY
jgi:hypothetical protein